MTASDLEHGADGSRSRFTRWLAAALVLSILLHVLFWHWAKGVSFSGSSREYYEKVVPRAFHLERVEIKAELLEPEPAKEKRTAMAPEAVALPQEKVAFEKLMAETKGEPAAPKIDQAFLSDKPTAATTSLEDTSEMARRSGAQSILEDTQSLQNSLLTEKPEAGTASLSNILDPEALTGSAIVRDGKLQGGDTPGFSNLDDLLARTGPLSPETAPILMPTDLLFDYDMADLRGQAVASLEKLGTLIRRNPQAAFLIEGHTDSFGSEEYNLALSQRRAESVKAWLVATMNIPADRIEARGFGKSRLIAPASGTIEEQQINRRVEIVIRAR
ncbi:MAG TPA: OmpA family protein [Terrimicrobiaceae bacterium]|nr:OmpA family protein [Terrimicrobiaceae bacterium]